MQVSIETTSGLERRLTVGVPAEVVDQEVIKRLNKAAKTVRINGFRKGKVPLKVVKQRFGEGVRQEVVGDTINRTFYEALQQESIRPAGQPSIESTQFGEGKDLEYIATFEVYPEIELLDVADMEVKKYTADISDADVDEMIENLRQGQAEWAEINDPVEDGCKVNIDFEGLKEGVRFDGGTAENHDLVIGSNTMIPGFEEGIIGMQSGDAKALDLTFPEDYQVEALRGAAVVFNIELNSVSKQLLPALDDEFFAKFGVTEGGEEKFREDVVSNMEREKQKSLRNKTKQQILDRLLERNPLEVPKALVDREIEALRTQTIQQYGAVAQNLDMKSLLPDDMFRKQAEQRSALGLLVSEIVAREKLAADKDVVRSLIQEAAASYEDPEEVINHYYNNERLLSSVEGAALEEQVVDFLLERAKVSEEKVSYEEALRPLPPKGAEGNAESPEEQED